MNVCSEEALDRVGTCCGEESDIGEQARACKWPCVARCGLP
jgi:hypothetical protein